MLLGTCYLETGQPDSAFIYFQKVAAQFPAKKAEATWYMALVRLKENDRKACIELLKTIREADDRPIYQKAAQLLKALRK
jgi:tetratricopeptide (TPR) repeat protein